MLRPQQWLKNLMLFFPPLLAGHAFMPGIVSRGLPAFIAFCLVSSSGYVFNDLRDCKRDMQHPQKSLRPLPSGTVSRHGAAILSALLLITGMSLASMVSIHTILLLVVYALISLLYSLHLKNIPIVDLFCVTAGFLIRLQCGGELFHIPISPWLFVTVFLLSVFLSTGKRLSELCSLGNFASEHRVSLGRYPKGFLSGTLYMTGCSVLVTYAMYALQKPKLIYTIPLCLFGLLRYMLRVSSGKGGDPTESLLKDWVLFMVGLLWLIMVVWSIYL
jgi:4-hydroxybenzoate polyprenyltransferase